MVVKLNTLESSDSTGTLALVNCLNIRPESVYEFGGMPREKFIKSCKKRAFQKTVLRDLVYLISAKE